MAAPPSGTVTFLFTDIEGSTQLWERHPHAMREALRRHDLVLRHAVESQRGYVVKTTGDGVHAAFADPADGIAAVLAAQRALAAEAWGETGPLRVRMGLHTGPAEAREGDYYGQSLNRAARLMAAGHGGQMLLSQATEDLVRRSLPPGTDLRDLGERRLKDLIRPERVFQVVAPDLPSAFPPLKTLDARPNNLPVQPTPLVGRDDELKSLSALLPRRDVRLLTLTGPGGTGKTRLALQIAADLVDEFEHGVVLVQLAPIRDPQLVAPAIAEPLGLMETSARDLADTVREHLRPRELLLVLDNFEQVAPAAPLIADILAAAPRLKVLVTSQWLLRLRGEHEFPVPPLGLPVPERVPSIQSLLRSEAVLLFLERARAARPDFELTGANATAVAEICRRLEGSPLAIELAAARLRVLPPRALLERLAHRLSVLSSGARDLPERQRTLRAAIAWSYDLLEPSERTLLSRLSVFVGGCTLAAADTVCDVAELSIDLLDGLASLVDKSLLRQTEQEGTEPWFAMLGAIREYGLERLDAGGAAEQVRGRHAAHYLELAEAAAPELRGTRHGIWFERLDREHDNIREALRWLRERGDAERSLRLALALSWFWLVRGHLTEGRAQLEALLAAPGLSAPTAARARALMDLAELARAQADRARARSALEEALPIWQRRDDAAGTATALTRLGHLAMEQADLAEARPLLERALAAARDAGDKILIARSLYRLATVALMEGHADAARTYVTEALALREELGDTIEAAESFVVLGFAAGAQGDDDTALPAFREALTRLRTHPPTLNVTFVLEGIARIFAARGEAQRAVRLAAAADALREAVGEPAPPFMRALVATWLEPAQRTLGVAVSHTAWEEGRAMTRDHAIDDALSETDGPYVGSAGAKMSGSEGPDDAH